MRPLLFPGFVLAPCVLWFHALGCGVQGAVGAAPQFDSARAWKHLHTQVAIGPRPAGSPGAEEVRKYVESELRSAGFEPRREAFRAQTPIGELKMENVYADLAGRDSGGEAPGIIVIAAHFDTKRIDGDFQGANDGASGTAVLLELARVMALGASRPLTYRFVFLDGEEAVRPTWIDPDNRYGSRHHVEELAKSGLVPRVRACVLIDMVGDADLQLTTEEFSDSRLLSAFFDAARELGLSRHVGGPRQPIKDDHQSFMAADIPSVDLIDFEYGPDNAYWHTLDDRIEHCSDASLGVIGRIVLQGLPKLEQFFHK